MSKFSIEAPKPEVKTLSRHRLRTIFENYAIKLAAECDSEKLFRSLDSHFCKWRLARHEFPFQSDASLFGTLLVFLVKLSTQLKKG